MKDIPGFEGKYQISTTGTIYSVPRISSDGRKINGRILQCHLDKDGYRRISLCPNGRGSARLYRVARLIALTYIHSNISTDLLVVNHLDGNKLNDTVENLEWTTSKKNTQHAWDNNLCQPYDRKASYNREGIINSNKSRRKWIGTHKEYCKLYYEKVVKQGKSNIYD